MKKKLLTILLSMFMIVTAFTTRVFAEIAFYTDADGTNTSSSSTGKAFGFEIISSSDPKKVALKDICDKTFTGTLSIPASVVGLDSAEYAVTKVAIYGVYNASVSTVVLPSSITEIGDCFCQGCGNLTTLIMNSTTPPSVGSYFLWNSDNITNIYVPESAVDSYKTANQWKTYSTKISRHPTIVDILPDDFPKNETGAFPVEYWLGDNGNVMYLFESLNKYYLDFEDEDQDLIVSSQNSIDALIVTSSQTNTYVSSDTFEDNNTVGTTTNGTMKFNVNDLGDLLNVEVSFGDNYSSLSGTYKPTKCIKDLLPDNFPKTVDDAWIAGAGIYLYYDEANSMLSAPAFSITIPVSRSVKSIGDNYYIHDFFGNIVFVMNNNELTEITAAGYSFQPKVTLADILPDNFPENPSSAWMNPNGIIGTYLDKDTNKLSIGGCNIPLSSILSRDGNDFIHVTSQFNVKFIMDGSKFACIRCSGGEYYYFDFNGLYAPEHVVTGGPTSISKEQLTDIEFVTNAIYNNESEVTVTIDDNITPLVLNEDYTLSHGSTHVLLKSSYLSSLSTGEHTLHIAVDEWGIADKTFTITATPTPSSKPKYKVPNTGVEVTTTNNHSLLKLSSLSLLAIGTYIVIKKKEE